MDHWDVEIVVAGTGCNLCTIVNYDLVSVRILLLNLCKSLLISFVSRRKCD